MENIIDFIVNEFNKYRIEEEKYHELATFIQTNLIDKINNTHDKTYRNKCHDLMDKISDKLVDTNAIVIYLKSTIIKLVNDSEKSKNIIEKTVIYPINKEKYTNKMTKSNTTDWRITQLEKDSTNIGEKVDKIMTNHLPHLHEEIQELKVRVNLGIGVNVFLYVSTILGIILFLNSIHFQYTKSFVIERP